MGYNKNPFVKSKSRKRKKKPVKQATSRSEDTKCPRTMVRFNNTVIGGPIWACKICMAAILSESAVAPHIAACKKANELLLNSTPPAKKDEEIKYSCKVCNKIFSRQVQLKKHEEEHNKSSNDTDFMESDDEPPKKRPKKFHHKNKKDDKYREDNAKDEDGVINDKPSTSRSEETKCPRTMERFNNTVIGGPVWICKMCMTVILTESAVAPHIATCKKTKELLLNSTPPAKKNEEMKYASNYIDVMESDNEEDEDDVIIID